MAKKKISIWVWIVAAVIIILIIVSVIQSQRQSTGEAVDVTTVQTRSITETVSASGRIFPETEVKISSDVSGEIVELLVEEGDTVKVGEVLARIDPEAYESRVVQGEASVNSAQVQLLQARTNLRAAKAQVAQTKSQLENAKASFERNKKLFNDGVISQMEFENAQTQLDGAQASYDSALANQESSAEGIKAAQYNIQSASAGASEIKTSLKRTTITSPTDGIVSLLNVEQGERVVGTIQMTGTEIMRIADLSSIEAQVEVSENDILRVNIGNSVQIDVDAYYEKDFTGIVTKIANSASNITTMQSSLTSDQVTNFIVHVRIDKDTYQDMIVPGKPFPFRPGMSTSVDIETKKMEDILSVPIASITTRDMNKDKKGDFEEDIQEVVFKVVGDTVAIQQVDIGIQDSKFIEIKGGLEEGDKIVSGPYDKVSKVLKSGDRIEEK